MFISKKKLQQIKDKARDEGVAIAYPLAYQMGMVEERDRWLGACKRRATMLPKSLVDLQIENIQKQKE